MTQPETPADFESILGAFQRDYDRIVGETFSLDRINDAVAEAATGKHIRVAMR